MTARSAPFFSAIVFDMDGLMLDTERLARVAWETALAERGRPVPWDVYRRVIGKSRPAVEEIFLHALGRDLPMAEVFERKSALMEEAFAREGVPLKPGLTGLLDALERAGVPMAVASSTYREPVLDRLSRAGILGRLAVVVGGDEVSESKPAPDLFLEAFRRLGRPPGECVVLEDSDAGIRAARLAGAIPIMVPDLVPPSDEIRLLAYAVLPSLREVLDFLGL